MQNQLHIEPISRLARQLHICLNQYVPKHSGAMMGRQSRIGHNQRQILTVLYDYSERYPQQWVPHYRIIDDLKMDESIFSRAIQGLVDPPNSRNDFKPLVEMTHPTIAYREFQGEVIPLPDNATMGDALFAMKFAWEGNTAQHNFYRITD
ncbi:MAG: hypothetical protein KJO60_12655, partial [Desulfofustis sp.]|nr:hypothetical protein [Desulfofustis sp.]